MTTMSHDGISRLLLLSALLTTGAAIDCYVCTSINENNKECEDTFNRDLSTFHFISRDCQYGYFSGTHCIKLKGIKEDGTQILVRHCSDSDWGKNCGDIRWNSGKADEEEEKIYGCLVTCNYDGCNAAPPGPSTTLRSSGIVLLILSLCLTLFAALGGLVVW